jgi:hypothetical protein
VSGDSNFGQKSDHSPPSTRARSTSDMVSFQPKPGPDHGQPASKCCQLFGNDVSFMQPK